MKKIFTFLFIVLSAISASAITVTFDGKAIENGGTVTVGADAFKLEEIVPGVIFYMEAESKISVTGATGLSLKASSETKKMTICRFPDQGGQCYQLDGASAPYSLVIPTFTDGVNIDLTYNGVNVVPQERNAMDVTIHSNEGDFKFTFVYDTTGNAGIGSVANDFNGVYTVYSIVGVKVLETTVKSDINNLPAGIYIVNGEKVIVR